LEQCFVLYARDPGFKEAELIEALLDTLFAWRLFTPFKKDIEQQQRLCRLLRQPDVGPARAYLADPLLKRLYWKNLLKRSSTNYRLSWRCEALRRAGTEILDCPGETNIPVDDPKDDPKNVFITHLQIHHVRHLKGINIHLPGEQRTHLILTGRSGSGKTSVLEALGDHLLTANAHAVSVTYNSPIKLEEYYRQGHFILAFYPAGRRLHMNVPTGLKKVVLKDKYSMDEEPGKDFIRYMVNLRAEKSFARDEKDDGAVRRIENWFKNFEEILKEIFQDGSLRLEFDRKNFNFNIIRAGKESFDFAGLSAGYSALVCIVIDLISRMEKYKKSGYDLQGVVLIDELEAHLDIEMEESVFPMLTGFFPGIQFIVGTHSSYIMASMRDVVIYDLGWDTGVSQ
jgi:nucleoside-triphosphatase THEP1